MGWMGQAVSGGGEWAVVHISEAIQEAVHAPVLPGLGSLGHCESPIEYRLGAAISCYMALRRRELNWEEGRGTVDFALTPQPWVETQIGSFRIDLLASIEWNGKRHNLAVECDGHAFHERTKAQAAHDRQRDRALMAAGYPVLRFTGSEIHFNSSKCAAEVIALLERATGLIP